MGNLSLILFKVGRLSPLITFDSLRKVRKWVYAGHISKKFKHLGSSCFNLPVDQIHGAGNIEIGDDSEFGKHLSISTWMGGGY